MVIYRKVKKALLHRKQYRQKNRRKRLKGEMEMYALSDFLIMVFVMVSEAVT